MIHPEANITWRDFDLNTEDGRRALERWLAEQAGYWVYHYDKDHPSSCYYCLMEPDSIDAVCFVGGHYDTEAEAWGDVPRWTESFEDAMLFASDILGLVRLVMAHTEDGWIAAIGKPDALLFVENAPAYFYPASAIIAAVCQWQEAKNGEATG